MKVKIFTVKVKIVGKISLSHYECIYMLVI